MFNLSCGAPVRLDLDSSFWRRYKSWYFRRSSLAREILDLSRSADCFWSAGDRLLEIKLNSRLDESCRASVRRIIISPSFLNFRPRGDAQHRGEPISPSYEG